MRFRNWTYLKESWGVPRSLSLFCGALLLLAAIAFVSWLLFSQIVSPPTANEIVLRYGLSWPPVKPEPVETYTFLVVLLCSVPVLCAAAYRLVQNRQAAVRPGRVEIVLITVIGGAIWMCCMDWPSIVPPEPAWPIVRPVRQHLGWFLMMTAVFAVILLIVERWSKHRSGSCGILFLVSLPMLGLSRLVLMNNSEELVNYPHYVAFVQPIVQDWLGRGILLNQKSLYGLYPIFLRPLWRLMGGPTTANICAVMAGLLFLTHIAFVGFIFRFTKHRSLAVVVALLAIVFTLFFYPFWPGETYFQHFPVRMVFPAIACGFMCLRAKATGRPYVAWAVLSFGWLWNLEGGLTAVLMFTIFEVARRYRPPLQGIVRLGSEQAGLALAGLLLAGLVITGYYMYRFGSPPSWGEGLRIIRIYPQGLWAEPMPMWGAWIFHVVIYLGAIFVGCRALLDPSLDCTRERYAALMAITAMGLVFLRYYQGRSMPLQLVYVSMPAIMCLGMLIDLGLSQLGSRGEIAARTLRLTIGAPLLSALVLYFASDPIPQRTWKAFVTKDRHGLDLTVDRIRSEFANVKRDNTDEVFVLAPYGHLFQLAAGKPSPLSALGMCELWFREDMDGVVTALRNPKTRMAVFDSNPICPLPIDSAATVAPILRDEFERISELPLCSTASYRAYIRKGARERSAEGVNVALGKRASQSSEFGQTTAAAAVDGHTDGRYERRSVTHTALNRNAWWEVDLGTSTPVDVVAVWNRTDCCSERLKNYWVFVSGAPFGPADTPEALRGKSGVWSHYEAFSPCPRQRIKVGGFSGRYVRVQLVGEEFLSLAEVQVFGAVAKAGGR